MANTKLNFFDKRGNPLNFDYIGATGPTPLDNRFTYITSYSGAVNPGDLHITESSNAYTFILNTSDLNNFDITEWYNESLDFISKGADVYLNGDILSQQNLKGKINTLSISGNEITIVILKDDYLGQSIISPNNQIYFSTTYDKRPGGYFKGNIYFDPVSAGLYENEQIFIIQEFLTSTGLENGLPHAGITGSVNPGKWRTRWYNDNYGETDISEIIFTYTIEEQLEGGDGEPLIVSYPNMVFPIDNIASDYYNNGYIYTETVNSEALAINVALNVTEGYDNIYERKLIVEDITNGIPIKVLEVDYYGQIIGEDDRFKVLLENVGRSFYNTDSNILRDHDPSENSPNFLEINDKRKELLIAGEEIYPYIGSYKGLINALKFFGYQDLRIKEYWLNLNYKNLNLVSPLQQNQIFLDSIKTNSAKGYTQSFQVGDILNNENTGKYKLTQTYGPDKSGNYVLNVSSENSILPSRTYKKTALFGLYYDLNKTNGDTDEFGYPTVIDAFKFTQEEVLIKIFALKERLKRDYLPLNARIIDITGEGVYFSIHNTRSWTDQVTRSDIEIGYDYGFISNPDFGFIEDLRNFSIRPSNLSIQIPNSYNNKYSSNVDFLGGTGTGIYFDGDLPNGSFGSNPDIILDVAKTYEFNIIDSKNYGADLYFTTDPGLTQIDPIGIVNNGATGGNKITWYINPEQNTDVYYYSNFNKSILNGKITFISSTISDFGNIVNPLDTQQYYTKSENVTLMKAIEDFYTLKQNDGIVELGDSKYDLPGYVDPTTGLPYEVPIGMPVILEMLPDRWTWDELNVNWTSLQLPIFSVGDRVKVKPVPAYITPGISGGIIVSGFDPLLDYGGLGYASIPTLTLSGGEGIGGNLSPVMSGSSIVGITINSGGSGYLTAPTIILSEPEGIFGSITSVDYSGGDYTILLDNGSIAIGIGESDLYAFKQNYSIINWDNIDFANMVDIEWIVNKSPLQPGTPYNFQFRGPIVDFYKLAHFLPYVGEYQVICNTYDAFNTKTSVIRNQSIFVEPKSVDIDSWTRYREVETYTWDNTDRSWDSYNSIWEYPAEGETREDVSKNIPSEILDFATYGNKSGDGQNVYVKVKTEPIGATGSIVLTQKSITVDAIYSLEIVPGQYGYAVVSTVSPHDLSDGDEVTIVGSIEEVNGRWYAGVTGSATTFKIPVVLESTWSGVLVETTPVSRYVVDTVPYYRQRITGAGSVIVNINGRIIGICDTGDTLYHTANELTKSINTLRTYPDYFASCINPEADPVTITISAPSELGEQENGSILTVTESGTVTIISFSDILSGGISPQETYEYWKPNDPHYPNANLKYWGTKNLDWEIFNDTTWDNAYGHTWNDFEFNNDWLGGYELHSIEPDDYVRVSMGNSPYPFPIGVTLAAGDLNSIANQLNNAIDPNITNFYYRAMPSDAGNLSPLSPPININLTDKILSNCGYNDATRVPPSLINTCGLIGSAILVDECLMVGNIIITPPTTTTTTSTTTTTTAAPTTTTTTSTTTSTTSTTSTTTLPVIDCTLGTGSAIGTPIVDCTLSTLSALEVSTTTTTTTTASPAIYTYYEAEYYDCVAEACTGLANPLWIYDIKNDLVINKYYYNDYNNKSFKILSAPKTYAEYVTAGYPIALQTSFGITYFNTCTCLTIAPE